MASFLERFRQNQGHIGFTREPLTCEEQIRLWFDQIFIDLTQGSVFDKRINHIENELKKGKPHNIYELQCYIYEEESYLSKKYKIDYPSPNDVSDIDFLRTIKRNPLSKKILIIDHKLDGCFITVFVYQKRVTAGFADLYYDLGIKLVLSFDDKASDTKCNIL